MTIRQMFEALGTQPWWVLVLALLAPPLAASVLSLLHAPEDSGQSPWRYLYSAIIYAVSLPSILVVTVGGYSLFFDGANLLDMNLLVLGGPLASMALTVHILKGSYVDIDRLPGFGRLMGLIMMIVASSVLALAISRLRILVVAGFADLLWLTVGVLVVINLGWGLLVGRSAEA